VQAASSRPASACSPVPLPRTGPITASSTPRVPQAASITSRNAGFAAWPWLLPGRPNAAASGGLSQTLTVVPSIATTSRPPRWDQAARPGDSAEHSRRNTDSSGFSPTRRRTPVSAVVAGGCHPAAASARPSPAVTCRITSPYGSPDSKAHPSTKYTPSRAGSARSRISHASPSPTASSTRPAGITQVKIPIPARARTRPRGDNQPHDMAP
jgi:hypothetical protein